jgi:hypothetical protein
MQRTVFSDYAFANYRAEREGLNGRPAPRVRWCVLATEARGQPRASQPRPSGVCLRFNTLREHSLVQGANIALSSAQRD